MKRIGENIEKNLDLMICPSAKVLIIPDVHGRKFWEEDTSAMSDMIDKQMIDVVFLGDYVDPYPFENISVKDAVENFQKIVDYAKTRANVHLLLGNHDMHYFDNHYAENVRKVRYSYDHAKSIKKIFKTNKSLFKIAWETKVNGIKFLFTHAGLLKGWAYVHMGKLHVRHGSIRPEYEIKSIEPTAESLNNLMKTKIGIEALADVSEDRGGWCYYGSPIWADVREHLNALEYYPPGEKEIYWYDSVYQVFGHTLDFPWRYDFRSFNMCYISPEFAMLDARTSFILEDDGSIHDITKSLRNDIVKDSEYYYGKDTEDTKHE